MARQGTERFGRVRNGKAGGSWQVRVRLGKARHGRLKPERRKSEVGRYKQKAILIRHQQVQSVC